MIFNPKKGVEVCWPTLKSSYSFLKDMEILNLSDEIGRNRKLWGDTHEITVVEVEYDENIATVYKRYYPNDIVIIGDAHQYLLNHYKDFDFIWQALLVRPITVSVKYMGVRYQGVQPMKWVFLLACNQKVYYTTLRVARAQKETPTERCLPQDTHRTAGVF